MTMALDNLDKVILWFAIISSYLPRKKHAQISPVCMLKWMAALCIILTNVWGNMNMDYLLIYSL